VLVYQRQRADMVGVRVGNEDRRQIAAIELG
jgi:hypothetical protein